MAKIKADILEKMLRDYALQGKILQKVPKHPRTIENWILNNSFMLTTTDILATIKEHYDLTDEQILELQPA